MPETTGGPAEKVHWKGSALLAPVPAVMVSCGTPERPNILTVAWTGVLSTRPPVTYVSVRPTRHSYRLILESGVFVINLTPAALVRQADFCGIYTGAKVNKFERCGLTPVPSPYVPAPMIGECPVSLSCRVKERVPLGSHDLFVAEIVGVSVSPELLDGQGKLHLERAGLCAYAHGEYYELGRQLGRIGFSTDKPTGGRHGKKGRTPTDG
ncbi:MAG: flavin reductase family protein [Eubacteriales bacterium]